MRQIYSRENVRKVGEEESRQLQEMFQWLGTPGSGDISRDEFERLKGYVLRLAFERYKRPTRYMKYFVKPEIALSPHEFVEEEQDKQYRARLEQIAELLPPQLLTFGREVSPHDGYFHRFDIDEKARTVDVQIEEFSEPITR